MDLYIYSDESGVFDKQNNQYFVYAGVIFLSKEEKLDAHRRYLNAERYIKHLYNCELKASKIKNRHKYSLYRSLNNVQKFVIYVDQHKLLNDVFNHKKTKQRYLDYMFKLGIKKALALMHRNSILNLNEIESINIIIDEHSTATNGKYELRESIETELKIGTFNLKYNKFHRPICNNLKCVNVDYVDSCKHPLVRASDIIANKYYKSLINNELQSLESHGWVRFGNPIIIKIK